MTLLHSITRLFGAARAPDTEDLLASLLVMAWMVEARDPYTGGHLWRVSRLSALLAEHAGRSEADVARVAIGGFLHDLGKIAVPDAILRKPDRLDDAEFDIIRTHPEVGGRLLAGHPLATLVRDAVTLHHERPDGRGYPFGHSGEAIPDDARIVGICDAFDAMTSHRPYRPGMGIDAAAAQIRAGLGTQFDGALGEVFLSITGGPLVAHVVGHSDDGIPLQECMMCGPTLVTTRESTAGDHVYCRSCTGEYRLESGTDGGLMAVATGHMGSAEALAPRADQALIQRLIRDTVARVPPDALCRAAR